MNSLTSKDKRKLIKEFSPSPGFVLKLSRAKFEELVDDTINIDYQLMVHPMELDLKSC